MTRHAVRSGLLVCLLCAGTWALEDDSPIPAVLAPVKPAEVEVMIQKGLTALARIQTPTGSFDQNARITSLAGMAFLAGGHLPTRGVHRQASEKCLKFVLSQQDPLTGFLGGSTHQGMYEHGFAALYLAECYGMTQDRKVRTALDAALDLVYRAQNQEGGWRYLPSPIDADISVTICQIMAIRAAYNVGVGGDRSQEVMQKAVAYVRRCANNDGSFNYMAGSREGGWGTRGSEGIPRAAAGSMCLIGAGINSLKDPVLGPALQFLRTHVGDHLRGGSGWYWYGQYYAAQAMFHSPLEKDWTAYWEKAVPVLASLQGQDGLWTGPDNNWGAGFNSAMALIILQIPNNYLPIFQR